MRIAVVQTNPVFGEVKRNIMDALSLMDNEKADLYVLPELFNTGYNFIDEPELRSLAEPVQGNTFKLLSDWTKKKNAYIIYGFAENDQKLYNSAAFAGPEGFIGLYRKVHLFYRENILFSPGDLGFPVFDLPFGKVGIMICFDWIYPESARSLALKGVQLIAHPSNLVLPYCPAGMVTRCLENRVFAATANRVGEEKRGDVELKFIGISQIVSPDTNILCRLSESEVSINSIEVDLTIAKSKYLNDYNDLLKGRRTDQY